MIVSIPSTKITGSSIDLTGSSKDTILYNISFYQCFKIDLDMYLMTALCMGILLNNVTKLV